MQLWVNGVTETGNSSEVCLFFLYLALRINFEKFHFVFLLEFRILVSKVWRLIPCAMSFFGGGDSVLSAYARVFGLF